MATVKARSDKGKLRRRKKGKPDKSLISYLRQYDIFNPRDFNDPITIVGCGGIGSSVATTLAKLGIKNINLIDDDRVEPHNIPNQHFHPDDIGKYKVDALATHISKLGAEPTVFPTLLEENEKILSSGLICSGLDSMFPRQNLWNIIKENKDSAYFDGRLGAQNVLLYGVDLKKKVTKKAYELTLHPEDEAEELPCTARGIIDVSFLVGALVTRAIRNYLKDNKIEFVQFIDWESLNTYRIPSASDYIKTMTPVKEKK